MQLGIIKKINLSIRNSMLKYSSKLEDNIVNNPDCRNRVVIGPFPTNKYGNILLINNVLCKSCTYNCLYCNTNGPECCSTVINSELNPYQLFFLVKNKIDKLEKANVKINYIAFMPNGEPTTDTNLARLIDIVRSFGYKIIVFTNSSLIWNDNVKENLMHADILNLRIDTVNEEVWNKLNRPHKRLSLEHVLEGIKKLSNNYGNKIYINTKIVQNINDNPVDIENLCDFISTLRIEKVYFTITSLNDSIDINRAEETKKLLNNKLNNGLVVLLNNEAKNYYENDFISKLEILNHNLPYNEKELKLMALTKGIDFNKIEHLVKNNSNNKSIVDEQVLLQNN